VTFHSEKKNAPCSQEAHTAYLILGIKIADSTSIMKHCPLSPLFSLSTGFLPAFLVFYQLWQSGTSTDFLPSFDDFAIFLNLRYFGAFRFSTMKSADFMGILIHLSPPHSTWFHLT